MADSSHQPTASPDEWVLIATRELKNLSGSYAGGLSNDAKVECALKATEAMLKAIIWKKEKWPAWPKKTKGKRYLFYHRIDEILKHTGLEQRLQDNRVIWPSWKVLVNVVGKQHRYSPTLPSNDEANEVSLATRHPDIGVVPWLHARYPEII